MTLLSQQSIPAVESISHSSVDLSAPSFQMKRVMVCTDFSEASTRAVNEAYRLCESHGAELSILYVLQHDDLSEWPDAENELALLSRERRRDLEALGAGLTTSSVAVRTIYRDGETNSILLDVIQDESPDLVVVGTHGKRGLDRLFLGSTAEVIVRNLPCPVMTVGSRVTFASPKSTPGPIVYATDFHDGAEESIAYAAFLSNQNRVPLHCIHVLPKAFVKTKNHIVAAVMDKALSDLQLRFGKDAVQPLCRTIFGKNVSKALVEYAREVHASAIVLAVTRRSAIASHLPLRRTSRILILANCPVFTLAHTKYVSP